MAVRTHDFALLDLLRDGLDRASGGNECTDLASLFTSDVIKVQDDHVGLAAVLAGVFLEVGEDELPILGLAHSVGCAYDAAVLLSIVCVVLSRSNGVASPAPGLKTAPSAIKGGEWLGLTDGASAVCAHLRFQDRSLDEIVDKATQVPTSRCSLAGLVIDDGVILETHGSDLVAALAGT